MVDLHHIHISTHYAQKEVMVLKEESLKKITHWEISKKELLIERILMMKFKFKILKET